MDCEIKEIVLEVSKGSSIQHAVYDSVKIASKYIDKNLKVSFMFYDTKHSVSTRELRNCVKIQENK